MDKTEKKEYVFSLDIGTRSIIGMVGILKNEKLSILAIEKEEHKSRAMRDGQIEDIAQVARVAASVKKKLEERTDIHLECVHVAAAGRALKTYKASYELELPEIQTITDDTIKDLENGAITAAEEVFEENEPDYADKQFYLIGYTVSQYYLDNYPISSLQDHKGRKLKADIIATFLPGEVVESLYASMQKADLEVASMTLEPIASMNAAIPQKLRLLNLVLVDIGAGTSDIAAARDGSISGYTMATIAGDEVTECLMKQYIIDFETAERLKMGMNSDEDITFMDVLGMEHTVSPKELLEVTAPSIQTLCDQIAEKVIEINGGVPSALFLAGGSSKLAGIREYMAERLNMDINRVALGGSNFSVYADSENYDLKDPEFSTPLGIAVSAAHNLINDSFYIKLNGQRAKLFRSGKLSIRDVLMMNGYSYKNMMSHSGQSLILTVNGERVVVKGGYAVPAKLLLNDEQAAVSDLVKAGDNITFEPAVNGEDAKAKVSDVVNFIDKGHVIWEEKEIPIGVAATVNGKTCIPDTELHNGDLVETSKLITAEDFIETFHIPSGITVNRAQVPMDWKLEDGDIIAVSNGTNPIKNLKKEEPKTTQSQEKWYYFLLNGKKIELKGKESQTPYYMMDMLTHVDIDLSKPDGDIILKVNGEEVGFQSELKDGDNIIIRWSGKS